MDQMIAQLTQILESWGYVGLFIGTALSTSFVPLPAGVIFVLCLTTLNPVVCIVVGTAGNTLGSMALFAIGRQGKLEWLTRYARINERRVREMRYWAYRHGAPVAFFCFVPGLGQAISVALGLLRSNPAWVAFYMMLGKGVRFTIVAILTYLAIDLL